MTRSEVERTQRTAALRTGLRVLVVGGFAGAAWLLSAAAANAAEANPPAEDTPTDLSVVSLVSGSGSGADDRSSLVTPLAQTLDSAVAPVAGIASAVTGGAVRPGDRASAVVLPSTTAASATRVGAPAPAAGRDTGASHGVQARGGQPVTAPQTRAGSTNGGLLGTVHGLAAPISGVLAGPTGLLTPLTRAVDPVVAPLRGVLRPVTSVLLTAAQPVTSTLGSVTRTVTGAIAPSAARRAHHPISDVAPAFGAVAAPVAPGVPVHVFGPRVTQPAEIGSTSTSADRRYAGAELGAAGTPERRQGGGELPDRPYPAPLRAYYGAGAGTPVSGPGSHSEGGGFAVVPSSVVQSSVAIHRLPVTTDVAVLRLEAEAPTVSPD